VTEIVLAGRSRGATGGWVRPLDAPGRILVPTVAHILYDRSGRLCRQVRLGGAAVPVHAVVQLPSLRSARADAALIAPDPAWAEAHLRPARGHLNSFVQDLAVRCRLPEGGEARGRLARAGWAGRMNYGFGTRWISGQWIVAVEHTGAALGARPLRRGDSGLLWFAEDGTAIGLQIGILSGRPHQAIVTPFETLCQLFAVRAAA
jgi:hypothetical protein